MHEISRSEAIAVGDLLAGERTPNARQTGESMPRRTRQAIRQRLLARGVLKECYVPDPSVLGRPLVCFAIGQPFADQLTRAVETWRSQASAVEVWSFQSSLFGMFLLSNPEEVEHLHAQLGEDGPHQSLILLDCDSRKASVPVFFDYEAAWAQVTGLPGSIGYPHALPSARSPSAGHPPSVSERDREAVHRLLALGRSEEPGSETNARWRTSFQGSGARRALREGWVESRTFLDLSACARWANSFPGVVAFVHGTLVDRATAPGLFHALVEEVRIHPFLFATDGGSVVFASLAAKQGEGFAPGINQPPRAGQVLQRFLRAISIRRDPLASLMPVVDHRYDSLVTNA